VVEVEAAEVETEEAHVVEVEAAEVVVDSLQEKEEVSKREEALVIVVVAVEAEEVEEEVEHVEAEEVPVASLE